MKKKKYSQYKLHEQVLVYTVYEVWLAQSKCADNMKDFVPDVMFLEHGCILIILCHCISVYIKVRIYCSSWEGPKA